MVAECSYRRRQDLADAVLRAGGGVIGGAFLVVASFFHDQGPALVFALGAMGVVLGVRSSARRIYRWVLHADGRLELEALRRRYDVPVGAVTLVYDDDWDDPVYYVTQLIGLRNCGLSVGAGRALHSRLR